MDTKLFQSVISGIVGTLVMTLIMYAAPLMGLPEMNPAAMLAAMIGIPLVAGWLLHFAIGIFFASVYVYVFNPKVPIKSKLYKGALFGLAVFIFAQIAMGIMGSLVAGPPLAEGSMLLLILGSILNHVVFGIFVALSVKR